MSRYNQLTGQAARLKRCATRLESVNHHRDAVLATSLDSKTRPNKRSQASAYCTKAILDWTEARSDWTELRII